MDPETFRRALSGEPVETSGGDRGAGEKRDPLSSWPRFASEVRLRLEAGRREYGDRSFSLPSGELSREIEEELLDVCGWSFVLWTRVRALREKVETGTT